MAGRFGTLFRGTEEERYVLIRFRIKLTSASGSDRPDTGADRKDHKKWENILEQMVLEEKQMLI